MANVSALSLTAPTDYGVEQKAIDRRRKLVEAMQAGAMAPMEMPQQPGVRVSPLAGLGKILGGYLAGQQSENLDTQEKTLAEKASTTRSQDLARAMRALEGTPAQDKPFDMASVGQDMPGSEPIAGLRTVTPAVPGSNKAMLLELMQSKDTGLRDLGQKTTAQMLLKENDEKFGHEVKFTKEGKPYLVSDKGAVKWLDPSAVTPRDPLHFANLGGSIQPLNQYTGDSVGGGMPTTIKPGEQATLDQNQNHWLNPSAHQKVQEAQGWGNLRVANGQLGVAQRGLALRGADVNFNTGMDPLGMFGGRPIPGIGGGGAMGGPQAQPQPMPQAMPQGQPMGMPQAQPQQPYGPRNPPQASQIPAQGGMQPGGPLVPPSMQGGIGITPKQRSEVAARQPQATQALQDASSNLDRMSALATQIVQGNVGGITGIRGAIPDVPGSSAANTRAALETLKTQVGFAALQAMRDASKTGGALGAISDRENVMLQNAWATLMSSQSEAALKVNLQKIAEMAQGSKQRMTQAYASEYGPLPEQPRPQQNPGRVIDFGSLR